MRRQGEDPGGAHVTGRRDGVLRAGRVDRIEASVVFCAQRLGFSGAVSRACGAQESRQPLEVTLLFIQSTISTTFNIAESQWLSTIADIGGGGGGGSDAPLAEKRLHVDRTGCSAVTLYPSN